MMCTLGVYLYTLQASLHIYLNDVYSVYLHIYLNDVYSECLPAHLP